MQTTRSRDGTLLAYDVHGSGPARVYITGASCFRSFKPIHMISAKALLPVLFAIQEALTARGKFTARALPLPFGRTRFGRNAGRVGSSRRRAGS